MKTLIAFLILCQFSLTNSIQAQSLQDQKSYDVELTTGSFAPQENINTIQNLDDKFPNQLFDGHYILLAQFHSIPQIETQNSLKSEGIKFINYIPNNTYHLAIPHGANIQALKNAGARSLFAPTQNLVVTKGLENRILAISKSTKVKVNLKYLEVLSSEKIITDLLATGITISKHDITTQRMEINCTKEQVRHLSSKPYLLYITEKPKDLEELDYSNTTTYGSRMVQHVEGITGNNVVVGVGDGSGWYHPDGRGRSTDYTGSNGSHGCFVSGVIAGNGNLYEKFTGHAPNAFRPS